MGAGIAFVSVPALVIVWKAYVLLQKEKAEGDKAMAVLLDKILNTINTLPTSNNQLRADIIKELQDAVQDLKTHIDNHVKPGSARRTSA